MQTWKENFQQRSSKNRSLWNPSGVAVAIPVTITVIRDHFPPRGVERSWWGFLTVVLSGNTGASCLQVNYPTKTIHHRHDHLDRTVYMWFNWHSMSAYYFLGKFLPRKGVPVCLRTKCRGFPSIRRMAVSLERKIHHFFQNCVSWSQLDDALHKQFLVQNRSFNY